jgi:hypothetical protein
MLISLLPTLFQSISNVYVYLFEYDTIFHNMQYTVYLETIIGLHRVNRNMH